MNKSNGKPVQLRTREFPTRSAAKQFFREMRERYREGERIIGEDAEDLAALLERHPKYAQKAGLGIDYFTAAVDQGPGYRSKCFSVVRLDGTYEIFSYENCITMKVRERG